MVDPIVFRLVKDGASHGEMRVTGKSALNRLARSVRDLGACDMLPVKIMRGDTHCFSLAPLSYWCEWVARESDAAPVKMVRYVEMPKGIHPHAVSSTVEQSAHNALEI